MWLSQFRWCCLPFSAYVQGGMDRGGSQSWLYIRVTWRAWKTHQGPSPSSCWASCLVCQGPDKDNASTESWCWRDRASEGTLNFDPRDHLICRKSAHTSWVWRCLLMYLGKKIWEQQNSWPRMKLLVSNLAPLICTILWTQQFSRFHSHYLISLVFFSFFSFPDNS